MTPSLMRSLDAKVEKRPLLRPAIPSPYAGSSQQKIVYISSKTPFLSAVKRVEKLLNLADKRLVQSATTNAKQGDGSRGKRKRGADGDEILEIAEEVERMKGKKRRKVGDGGATGEDGGGYGDGSKGEEVVMKGTGKAIHRVLELALWFQQRDEEYVVRLRTGSIGAIDDVSVEEDGASMGEHVIGDVGSEDVVAGAEEDGGVEVDMEEGQQPQAETLPDGIRQGDDGMEGGKKERRKRKRGKGALAADDVPETRVRYASVLEAAVSLR